MFDNDNKTDFQRYMEEMKKINEKKRLAKLLEQYPNTPDFSNMSLHDELKTRFDLDELKQLQQKYPNPIEAVYDFGQTMGTVAGNLKAAKDEMDKVKKDGYDNYAHRLGMCLNAQGGYFPAALSLGAGMLKEGKDIYCKAFDHKIGNIGNKVGLCNRLNPLSFGEAWDDSVKDMTNNIEGIQYGLNNPQKSCRQWLNDLDYRNNRWIR